MAGRHRDRPKRYVTEPEDERRKNGPVTIIRPEQEAWKFALKDADGDVKRCRAQEDGSVIIK